MHNLTIFCDLDGVVADIMTNWLLQYNKDYNDTLKVSDITSWDTKEFVKPECGSKIEDYLHKKDFFLNAGVYPDSQKYLKKIVDDGHQVYFATSSPIYMYPLIEKHLWVEKYFPFIGKRKVVCIKDKYLLDGDILIDDYDVNLDKFKGHKILFERPWNRNISDSRFINSSNWFMIYEIIKNIERRK